MLLSLLAFRCPGPDPLLESDDGGGGGGGGGGDACDPDAPGATLDDPLNCGACGRACFLQNVAMPLCRMGRCESICESGFVNLTLPGPELPDDGCELPGRRVFVTPLPVLADFGGAAEADAICQDVANTALLGGLFRAWVSDDSTSPDERFVKSPPAPYVLPGGEVVAPNWGGLTSNDLLHPIDQGPMGELLPTRETWTGTFENGLSSGVGYNCANWTSTAPSSLGSVGLTDKVGDGSIIMEGWSEVFIQECSRDNVHLYCFEQ